MTIDNIIVISLGILVPVIFFISVLYMTRNEIAAFWYKHKKKIQERLWIIAGILALICFTVTALLFNYIDSYQQKQLPSISEEEKELIEWEHPKGVPTRYW